MNWKKTATSILVLSLASASAAFAAPGTLAAPSTMQITLDGKLIGLSGYEIADNNYFKLRDLAYALRETDSRFAVDFDGQTITLGTGKDYVPVGGEMTGTATVEVGAKRKEDALRINQQLVTLTGYEIEGYNYFKLRDLGDALDFDVDFDAPSRTVILKTEKQDIASVPEENPQNGQQENEKDEQQQASDAEAVLELMNAARAEEGTSGLKLNDDLCKAAQIRAEEIAELFSHTRPNDTKCFTVLEDIGWQKGYRALGENIAMGQTTPEIVMDSWMNSPGHRANILNADFKEVGIARSQNGWVQFFWG